MMIIVIVVNKIKEMNRASQFAKQDEILEWDKCMAFQFSSMFGNCHQIVRIWKIDSKENV